MYQFQTLQYVAGDSYFLHGAVCLGVQTFDFTFQATWDRSKRGLLAHLALKLYTRISDTYAHT